MSSRAAVNIILSSFSESSQDEGSCCAQLQVLSSVSPANIDYYIISQMKISMNVFNLI